MPELAGARRVAAVDFEVIARTLRRRITIRTDKAELYEATRYLECDPEIEGYIFEESLVRLEVTDGICRIVENGSFLQQQLHNRAVIELSGTVRTRLSFTRLAFAAMDAGYCSSALKEPERPP